jgi:GTP:adenosylcobinamide-phosphate guanylyltransferase
MRARDVPLGESQLIESGPDRRDDTHRTAQSFSAVNDVGSSGFVDDMTYWVGAMTDHPALIARYDLIGLDSQGIGAMPPPP